MNASPVREIAKQSRIAARKLSSTSESQRNLALSKMADSLESVKQQVLDVRQLAINNPPVLLVFLSVFGVATSVT